jgi:hypothetical protein
MAHVAANVRGCSHALGVETVGIDLQASSFSVERINDTLQPTIAGVRTLLVFLLLVFLLMAEVYPMNVEAQ